VYPGGDRHGRLPSLQESSQSFTEFLGLYGVDAAKLGEAGRGRWVVSEGAGATVSVYVCVCERESPLLTGFGLVPMVPVVGRFRAL
jgi:hypothetical protein